MSLPSNWNKSRWICKELGYHQYEPASPLKYGSFCRGTYECRACGKVKPAELLQNDDIVYGEVDYKAFIRKNQSSRWNF